MSDGAKFDAGAWQEAVARLAPLRWSTVGGFSYWPKCDEHWTSPIPISNLRRLRTMANCINDPAALRRLKRYWKRMAREGKMK